MGGYGSGGHRWGRSRATVESCFRFDARQLGKLLTIPTGKHLCVEWTYTSGTAFYKQESGRALAAFRAGDSFFTLRFERDDETETQKIGISFSSCRFGGRRVWLHCPMCWRRVFRLYLYPHLYAREKRVNRFYCRSCMCGGLSYYLRNTKDLLSIGQERAQRAQRKLKDTTHGWDFLPDKPRWMRWNTYARLATQHQNAVELANAGSLQRLARLSFFKRDFPELADIVRRTR